MNVAAPEVSMEMEGSSTGRMEGAAAPGSGGRLRRAAGAFGAGLLGLAGAVGLPGPVALAAEGTVYYQCPGNVFTNMITAREAEAKGCKSREAQQPTTIPAPRARPVASPGGPASRVDAQEQRDRDSDARKILLDELAKAQAQLDALKKDYNNGAPERQGNEKNYQKYLDRTAELKASIDRTESDIAAINRELAKTQ